MLDARKDARMPVIPNGLEFGRMFLLTFSAFFFASCSEFQQPKVEPFYSVTEAPPKQELRWSNGKYPKSLDPAKAAAAPETDIIRAVYEGLTDLDSKSLREIPGVAEKWESSGDLRTWTFRLRKDAKWSNGERVTARDFVRSWKRLAALGEKTANSYLFKNIVGMASKVTENDRGAPSDFLQQISPDAVVSGEAIGGNDLTPKSQLAPQNTPSTALPSPTTTPLKPVAAAKKFGVEALDDVTLMVTLELPDKDFPKLVANPVFRPVYENGANLDGTRLDPATVTNGGFYITKVADDGITLERSDYYWNRRSVALEQIRFVPVNSAESALSAYRKGELDVITNASFEPLALKLLAPYEDFRRTAHSALNFYEFNTTRSPFNDRRVREAFAIAIDRAKLTDGDLEGTNQPAYAFFPAGTEKKVELTFDSLKAKQLLEKAGFPDGKNFPSVRLVVNRNDIQLRVARSIVRMWKQYLNIDVEIDVKEPSEIDGIRESGDFDMVRRGVVFPTNDELANIESVLGSAVKATTPAVTGLEEGREAGDDPRRKRPSDAVDETTANADELPLSEKREQRLTFSEADVMYELQVIPLYFPTSYSLVKPYIRGFEMNSLDAPSLKEVSIDSNWQPRPAR